MRSRLDHALRDEGRHHALWRLYHELLRLRRAQPSIADVGRRLGMEVTSDDERRLLAVHRWTEQEDTWLVMNYSDVAAMWPLPAPAGSWTLLLNSAASTWMGPGEAALRFAESVEWPAHAAVLAVRPRSRP